MRRSFEARFVSLFAGLMLVAACSGKSESNPQAGGQAGSPSGASSGGSAGSGGAGGTSAGISLAGVGSSAASAGVGGDAVGGSRPDPCGGDPGPAAAGTGVIGGTYGNGGEAGAAQTVLDCSAYVRCSVHDTSCPLGTSCTRIPGCQTPICGADLCDACPGECSYLLSLPGQIKCVAAEYVGIEPYILPVPCN